MINSQRGDILKYDDTPLPSPTKGTLYLVSTPIGNLEDITLRALRILKEVNLIAAEDTRHTGLLLKHFGIQTPLTSYFEGNELKKTEFILSRLKQGDWIALVSDAGTPGISDPGFRLIQKAIENQITVVPIPGPSAVIAALSVSGLPTDAFLFKGFLPHKSKKRRDILKQSEEVRETLIFYESPHRLSETLKEILDVLGDRNCPYARTDKGLRGDPQRKGERDPGKDWREETEGGDHVADLRENPKAEKRWGDRGIE